MIEIEPLPFIYQPHEDREQMLVLNSTDVTLLVWVVTEVEYERLFVLKST